MAPVQAQPRHRSLTPAALAEAMARAEQRCKRAGQRWTDPRRRTYEMLLAAGAPVKAYDLIRRYSPSRGATKPPTVYRSLDVLTTLGLVHKVQSLSAYVACTELDSGHTAAFLVCNCCGAAEELAQPEAGMTLAVAVERGFTIESTSLEMRGRCRNCC